MVTLNTDKDIAKTVIHPYPQNGWTVNSENLSLYLGQKAINVKFDGNQSPFSNGGGILKLSVLGYRWLYSSINRWIYLNLVISINLKIDVLDNQQYNLKYLYLVV